MKKTILYFLVFFIGILNCNSQEWFTSFDVAKRLALVQNKMLFVMWEESTEYPFQIFINDEKGNTIVSDMFEDESVNRLIWEYFIPVKISEFLYDELYQKAMGRGISYLNVLNGDDVKIMDINGNILNLKWNSEMGFHLTKFIKKYALNTSFVNQELIIYNSEKNLNSAFNLGAKYLDFAMYVDKNIKVEVLGLAKIYFDESEAFLNEVDVDYKTAFLQKLGLLKIKEDLILNKSRRAARLLKKFPIDELKDVNRNLYNFLNYTTFKVLGEEEQAILWKEKVSAIDLKKAVQIINNK